MNKEIIVPLSVSVKNLMNTITDHAINDTKVSADKVHNLFANYEKYNLEKNNFEQNLDNYYQQNIKFQRINKSMAIEDYLNQRSSLYEDYKDNNNTDSLRKLLDFQIKTIPNLKKINEDIKYENIYTKYANIRMLS